MSYFRFVDRRCLYAINWLILLCGIKKSLIDPFQIYFFNIGAKVLSGRTISAITLTPDIISSICEAPSEAKPANADILSVLPTVGAKALPIDKILAIVNWLPATCFLILVLANLISVPLFNLRFLFNLFTIFEGT